MAGLGLAGLRVGIDIAQISQMQSSLDSFGERFVQRLFRPDEAVYALQAPALAAQRLAARFAAKEAAIKAFDWSECGVDWRCIEVRRHRDGACTLVLHDRCAELARHSGCTSWALSLSHDGDYAAAVVAAAMPPDDHGARPSSGWPH